MAATVIIVLIGLLLFALRAYRKRFSEASWRATPKTTDAGTQALAARRAKALVQADKNEGNPLDWNDDEVSSPLSPDAAKKTILIADDDPVVVYALKRRLEKLGFEVMRSPDSAHALLGAMKMKPDLVILDINMPGGNGLAVCEMMASDPRYASIPVIIHSTLNDDATIHRTEQLGAHYVRKSPQSWREIHALIHDLVGDAEGADAGPTQPTASEAVEAATLRLPVCGQPRALCIDGSRDELEPTQRELIALGVDAVRVGNLQEGFWSCFTEKPHVIIVHTDAPDKELVATLERFWQHPVTRPIPVVLLADRPPPRSESLDGLNLTILDGDSTWAVLRRELERLLPIVDTEAVETVPPPKPPEAAEATPEPDASEAGKYGLKILCIDDDPVIAKSIALRLEPYGIKVLGASNGTEGFFTGLREQPDLILLDLEMPEGGGNYILSRFKGHSGVKDTPVVVLTAETNAGVRRGMIASGAAGFLSKPVRWRAFLEELGRHIPLPRRLIRDYQLSEEELLAPP